MRRALLVVDALLVALALYLTVQVAHAWRAPRLARPSEAPRPAPSEPPPVTAPVPSATGPVPPVIAQRNLFSPTRSEAVPEPPRAAAQPAAPPPPRPRLYGIVILPDGRSRAFLEDVQRRRVFGYSVGEAVAGSRVEQIQPDRVVLSRGSETFEVLLRDPSKPKPRPVAAPPAAPGRALPAGAVPGAPPGTPPGVPAPGNPVGDEAVEAPAAPARPRTPPRAGRLPAGPVRPPGPPGFAPGAAVPAPPPGPGPVPAAPPPSDEDDDS